MNYHGDPGTVEFIGTLRPPRYWVGPGREPPIFDLGQSHARMGHTLTSRADWSEEAMTTERDMRLSPHRCSSTRVGVIRENAPSGLGATIVADWWNGGGSDNRGWRSQTVGQSQPRRLAQLLRKTLTAAARRLTAIAAVALAVLGAWCATSTTACAESVAAGRFIALSDLHLDPFSSPDIATQLVTAPPERWPAILEQSGPDRYGTYGRDSTWALVQSALDQMRAVEPAPAFIVLTGDLIAHRFRQKFEATIGQTDEDSYRRFVGKTIAVVGEEIIRRFPGKRIFLALGNEDSECGDYKLTPHGAFLQDTLPLARRLTGAAEASFDRDWLAGRGYDLSNAAIPRLRMIYVNSVYLSAEYRDACGTGATDVGQETLTWLSERLASAERTGESVWLLFHIPPGADPYATIRRGSCPNGLTDMWAAGYAQTLVRLVERHARTVTATFAAHTHMDEFRLIGRNGRVDGFVVSTPAISPIFGQNPGFHVYSYGRSGELVDRDTWRVEDLSLPMTGGSRPLAWTREYRFSELWQLSAIDGPSLARLSSLIGTDPRMRARWFSVYPVGRTANWVVADASLLPEATFRPYQCAMGRVIADEFRDCVCGTPPR
jgi:sphingomyelin phosphodiesterase acid-like 3